LLSVDGDDALAAEAGSAVKRIAAALPDADMRRRFAAADAVREVTRLTACATAPTPIWAQIAGAT
jgi:hypothetical protein